VLIAENCIHGHQRLVYEAGGVDQSSYIGESIDDECSPPGGGIGHSCLTYRSPVQSVSDSVLVNRPRHGAMADLVPTRSCVGWAPLAAVMGVSSRLSYETPGYRTIFWAQSLRWATAYAVANALRDRFGLPKWLSGVACCWPS